MSEDTWLPPMAPTQERAFWDKAPFILLEGERGSGKTMVGLHKLVDHCREHDGALAMVVTLTRAGATAGGAWEDLLTDVEDHRGEPAGVLAIWAKGIGLEYSDEYGDSAKNKFIDIRTANGGVSRIMQVSLPSVTMVRNRIKTFKPSFFLFEELTNTNDADYFLKPIQQLGRRKGVPASAQQYVASCNPADDGEAHWVYQAFHVAPWKKDPKTGEKKWDSKYSVYHIPMTENVFMEDKEGYIARVEQECLRDPTAYDRLILGKWVAKITGSGVFEGFYDPRIHLKGSINQSGLSPIPYEDGALNPIIVGYDPGDVNNARVFYQRHKVDGKFLWRVLAEVVGTGERKKIEVLVEEVLNMMLLLNNKAKATMPYIHIGDKQGWTHWNPQGDFTYKKMYEISKELIRTRDKFKELSPILMKAPEKSQGSVVDRVQALQDRLLDETFIVSGLCPKVDEMFRRLKKKKEHGVETEKPLKTPTGEIHVFDAASYPVYYYDRSNYLSSKKQQSKKELEIFAIAS